MTFFDPTLLLRRAWINHIPRAPWGTIRYFYPVPKGATNIILLIKKKCFIVHKIQICSNKIFEKDRNQCIFNITLVPWKIIPYNKKTYRLMYFQWYLNRYILHCVDINAQISRSLNLLKHLDACVYTNCQITHDIDSVLR